MGAITSIEWTDASWTPIRARNRETGKLGWHCTHVSEACRNCYAEGINKRLGTGLAFKPGHLKDVEIFLDEAMLLAPLRWRKARKIFVCSMTDLFADFVPDEMIDKVFAVAALCPQHTFQVLTKRPERMRVYLATWPMNSREPDRISNLAHQISWGMRGHSGSGGLCTRPLPNVWLGTSAEDQPAADARIPDLLATPAAVRFVSLEPMLGPIDLTRIDFGAEWLDALAGYRSMKEWANDIFDAGPRIDWVICGGESGPHARPMHPDWARSLRDQCAAAGVPFFFKQWGEWIPEVDRERDDPDWRLDYSRRYACAGNMRWLNLAGGMGFHGERFHVMRRVGKARAGRILDGRTHDDLPTVRP